MNRSRKTTQLCFALLLLALLAVAGCAPAKTMPKESADPTPSVITVEELNTMLQSKNFPLINVQVAPLLSVVGEHNSCEKLFRSPNMVSEFGSHSRCTWFPAASRVIEDLLA